MQLEKALHGVIFEATLEFIETVRSYISGLGHNGEARRRHLCFQNQKRKEAHLDCENSEFFQNSKNGIEVDETFMIGRNRGRALD